MFVPFSLEINAENPNKALLKEMKKDGYISIEKAVSQFETLNKTKIKLPSVPFKAHYKLGRVNANGELSLQWWTNPEITDSKIFIVHVKKAENKITYANPEVEEKLKLSDGTVVYFGKDNFYTLTFVKNGLEYSYGLDKKTFKNKKNFLEIIE